MIIKKIDLNKILSKNEFHQLEHDLSKLIFENIILKDKNDIYKYKYNYNINNLQNLLKLFKEKTNTDYSYLKKIYKMILKNYNHVITNLQINI